MEIHITGLSLFILAVIYAPIVLLILFMLWKMLTFEKTTKTIVTITVFIAALVAPFYDVFLTSIDMKTLCNTQAGLHIYRSVEVDGFSSGYLANEKALDHGYKYVERRIPGGKYVRYVKENGEVRKQPIVDLRSRYVVSSFIDVWNSRIERDGIKVTDRTSGEVLGEAVDFASYPGWFDRLVFFYIGDFRPWRCDMQYIAPEELYLKTLVPQVSES